jgi:hypothetical protein
MASTAVEMKRLEPLSAWDVAYSANMAIASLTSYWITTYALSGLVGSANDYLGGMWATVATIFVFRDTRTSSLSAGVQRFMATCVSFLLCQIYLSIFPFEAVGVAVLIDIGTLLLMVLGWRDDIVTTGITTVVVMVVAAIDPPNAWLQPPLRLLDTVVGIAVGIGFNSSALALMALYKSLSGGRRTERQTRCRSSESSVARPVVTQPQLNKHERGIHMIRCVRLWTGGDGNSHFAEGIINLEAGPRGDFLSNKFPITAVSIQETNVDPKLGWHTDAARQLVITLGGVLEFSTRSGAFRLGEGDVLFTEENGGTGHDWRMLDGQPWRRLYAVLDAATVVPFQPSETGAST